MKKSLPAVLALLAAIGTSNAVGAKEPLRLAGTSKWHVDYGEQRCRLAREFGEGEDKVTAVFDKFGPDDSFRMTLAGKPMRMQSNEGRAEISFGPNEQGQKQPFFAGKMGDSSALLFTNRMRIAGPTADEQAAIDKNRSWLPVELSPIDPAREAAVKYLQINKPLRQPVILETGSMRKAFAALDSCIDNLMTTWGIDVEKHKQLSRVATPVESPARWITTNDYPLDMLSSGQPGLVEFRLNIAADGKPGSCQIQATTRPKAFDDAVCKSLMKRAKFIPALDAEGKPLASYWRSSVRFIIP